MDTQIATTDRLMNTSGLLYSVSKGNNYTKPNAPELVGPHIHNCYEIYANVSGNISFLVNNKVYDVSSGDIIFTKAGDVHHCICNEPCVHEHFCVWFEDGASVLTKALQKYEFPCLKPENFQTREELFYLLKKLHSLFETENFISKTSTFMALIDLLLNKTEISASQNEKIPVAFQNVLDYMNEHFAEIQYISEINEKFFISAATLNRWFRKYLNLSPREFLEAKKLSLAEQLLQKGYSVTDAGEISGFTDISHFITVFKKKFGKTPHKYKQHV